MRQPPSSRPGGPPRPRFAWLVAVALALCAAPLVAQERPEATEDGPDPQTRPQEGDAAPSPGHVVEGEVPTAQPFAIPLDWFVVPIVGYSPDTSVALASIGILRFRFGDEPVDSRPSTLALLLTWTFNQQVLIQVGPQLYIDDEKWFFRWETIFEDWPEPFFGVGPQALRSDREDLNRRSLIVKNDLRRAIVGKNLYVGLLQSFNRSEILEVKGNGTLSAGLVDGATGGTDSGLGFSLLWDTRDSDVYPRKGVFLRASGLFHRSWLGSDFTHDTWQLDARTFTDLGGQHVLALQALGELNTGTVPFYNLSSLGGLNQLRGFLRGRFRDKAVALGQAEYRSPYVWRVAAAAFIGAGQVQPDVGSFNTSDFSFAGGGGFRFAINREEGINMRADFGVTDEGDYGAYLGFLEAF